MVYTNAGLVGVTETRYLEYFYIGVCGDTQDEMTLVISFRMVTCVDFCWCGCFLLKGISFLGCHCSCGLVCDKLFGILRIIHLHAY